MNGFGEYLKDLRGDRSLREMERITGLSHTYLSTLEKGVDPRSGKGRKPTPEILNKLSETLDVDYFELMQKAGYIEENNKVTVAEIKAKTEILKRINDEIDGLNYGLDTFRKLLDEHRRHYGDTFEGNETAEREYKEVNNLIRDNVAKIQVLSNERHRINAEIKKLLIAAKLTIEFDESWKFKDAIESLAESIDFKIIDLYGILKSDTDVSVKGKKLNTHEKEKLLQMIELMFDNQ